MKKLRVCGKNGRMAAKIRELAVKQRDWELVEGCRQADVVIDFTAPEGTAKHLAEALESQKPIVIGTTGLSEDQMLQIRNAAKKIPVLYSPNMAPGVNVLFQLVEAAAKNLGSDFAAEISETHHIHKKDRPSGTAKVIGKIVEAVTGKKPPIESLREGEEIGEHSVVFGSPFEHLILFHRSLDRKVFADGALRAAKWILGKNPGLYTMAQVLENE